MSDHPIIRWVNDFVKDGAPVDEALKRRMLLQNDTERVQDLKNLHTWLDDSSTNLRSKAQLVKLERELNHLHQAMRRSGR
jgi:hypothetical protein